MDICNLREFPWNPIDNRCRMSDFSSLSKDYGQPLIIHFYSDLHGNKVSRIGGEYLFHFYLHVQNSAFSQIFKMFPFWRLLEL